MTIQVNILRNKVGQQTTLNLVPTLNGAQVITAKQAYVFGGPLRLSSGNGKALVATSDQSVAAYFRSLAQSGRIDAENLSKDPWPVSATEQVALPSSLLLDPIDDATFSQNFNSAARTTAASYEFISIANLSLSSSTTIDLKGKAAFVWYAEVSLCGTEPLVIVTPGALDLTSLGASASTVDVTTIQTTRGSTTAPVPTPAFDMYIDPFSNAKPFRLAASLGRR